MISSSDFTYLEVVEHQSFDPMGFLYRSIYADLRARGLVKMQSYGAFIISEAGKQALAEYRATQ